MIASWRVDVHGTATTHTAEQKRALIRKIFESDSDDGDCDGVGSVLIGGLERTPGVEGIAAKGPLPTGSTSFEILLSPSYRHHFHSLPLAWADQSDSLQDDAVFQRIDSDFTVEETHAQRITYLLEPSSNTTSARVYDMCN